MSYCLKLTDVDERLGAPVQGDKPIALLSVEPFDDCIDRLRGVGPRIARSSLGRALLGSVIVITAALWLTVFLIAAHRMSVRICNLEKLSLILASEVNKLHKGSWREKSSKCLINAHDQGGSQFKMTRRSRHAI